MLHLREADKGRLLAEVPMLYESFLELVFARDGKTLVTVNSDRVSVWDLSLDHAIVSLVFTIDKDRVSKLPTKMTKKIAKAHGVDESGKFYPVEPNDFAFSRDGRLLATAARDVRVWDVSSGKQIGEPLRMKEGTFEEFIAVGFDSSGDILATLSGFNGEGGIYNHEMRLWNVAKGTALAPPFCGAKHERIRKRSKCAELG
jgi:WD40 repeat protein